MGLEILTHFIMGLRNASGCLDTIKNFEDIIKNQHFRNCINYFRCPFELIIFDNCGTTFEGIEQLNSVKIKYNFSTTYCEVFIKALRRDCILAFYTLIAKSLFEDYGRNHVDRLDIRYADVQFGCETTPIYEILYCIDALAVGAPTTTYCEIYMKQSNMQTDQYAQVKALTPYLIEGAYNYFLEEQRRQALVCQNKIPPLS